MKNIYKTIIALALGLGGFFQSCSEADSDVVAFVEDNRLDSPNDTVYSLMGIINKMQVIADRTILLGELRGDLTSLTDHATLDLQDIANFKADVTNPYNRARDYYAVIQNCNYFLANADTLLAKRGYKVFEKEYAAVKAYRAWTYLQLAINYGSVPFFTEPILAEKNADPSLYPHYDVKQIANYFIKDLQPYMDTNYPSYGDINGQASANFYIPVRVLLGDLCLWAERYTEAAQYYHDFLTKQGNTRPTGVARIEWADRDFETLFDNYASQSTSSSEILTFIPMEASEYDGIISHLDDVFNSTEDNNYYYQATHSTAYDEISRAQRYVGLFTNPLTQMPDTLTYPEDMAYPTEALRGDLRQYSIYPPLRSVPSSSSTYSSLRQTCQKYRDSNSVSIYRLQHVYLRYAEALNRAGFPESAFAVLKHGIWYQTVEKYISEKERAAAGNLISFSEYTFTRENTRGIHSRGSGSSEADTLYVIPELPSAADSILYVEDRICDEMALETAAEGLRFPDLMRLSMHRQDPTFLAGKVARRNGSDNYDAALFSFLSDEKNWYLPLE